jgi:hypothetical protein
MKYPKAFEKYWYNTDQYLAVLGKRTFGQIKHIAYLAWKAGRKYQKQTYGS